MRMEHKPAHANAPACPRTNALCDASAARCSSWYATARDALSALPHMPYTILASSFTIAAFTANAQPKCLLHERSAAMKPLLKHVGLLQHFEPQM